MKTILLIDPFHSGRYLVNRLQENSWNVVVLQTMDVDNNDYYKSDLRKETHTLTSTGDLEQDVKMIREFTQSMNLVHGIAGTEASLEYADKILNELFPRRWNSTKTTNLRYKKFDMQKRLRDQGLPFIDSLSLSKDLSKEERKDEGLGFYCKHGKNIIIKPDSSICSEGFLIPATEEDIINYLHSNSGSTMFSKADTLLQQRIRGQEYYCDIVSHHGVHHICVIGKAYKEENSRTLKSMYKEVTTLTPCEENKIINFIYNVLDALDVSYGFSHIEFIQQENDLYLIELNPRISGLSGGMNYLTKIAYFIDQVDAYSLLIEGKKIPEVAKKTGDSGVNRLLYLYNMNEDNYAEFKADLSNIPSYHYHQVINLHDRKEYKNLMDASLFIILSHSTKSVIDQDMKHLFCNYGS